jgi:hypothetical protein
MGTGNAKMGACERGSDSVAFVFMCWFAEIAEALLYYTLTNMDPAIPDIILYEHNCYS